MVPSISVLITGSEVLCGKISDTNSGFINRHLNSIGLRTKTVLAVNDSEEEIVSALGYLTQVSNFVVVMGGLGPTDDDLTREAIAKFSNKKLELDESAHFRLAKHYKSRNIHFDGIAKKQAFFPQSSTILANKVGSADGFYLQGQPGKFIFAIPGVPREMEVMFPDQVLTVIKEISSFKRTAFEGHLKVFWIPESTVNSLLEVCGFGKNLEVAYQTTFPINQLYFRCDEGDLEKSKKLVQVAKHQATLALGKENVFSDDEGQNLAEVVGALLLEKKQTIATAESCTAGLLGKLLTETPGSSSYFLGGVQSYSNEVKKSVLGVDPKILESQGAVSSLSAELMAKGARELIKSDIGISITGIAGPDGGTADKPVGLFYIGISTKEGGRAFRYLFPSTRERVRTFAAYCALDTVRRMLQGHRLEVGTRD